MKLEDIVRVAFKPGDRFYDHDELEALILNRYGYTWGRYMNSKAIRRAGIPDIVKKVNGKAVRGFMLEISDLTLEQIEASHKESIILYQTEEAVKEPVFSGGDDIAHKHIRFLIKDWEIIPLHLQLKYKKYKEQYLKEVLTGAAHETDWFFKIIDDLPYMVWPGADVDFVIQPAREIVAALHEQGLTKRSKRPDMDKMHFILNEHGFVRINDYVYGRVITKSSNHADGLPDY